MPRNAREPTLARQWELLKLIPRHRPGFTPRGQRESLAAAGHDVTKRTVERDLRELSIVFPLECNDSSSRTIHLKVLGQSGKYVFPPNSQMQKDHPVGLLMTLAAKGEWRNPPLGSAEYERVSRTFRRLRKLLMALVPLPGDPFHPHRGAFVPVFQIGVHAGLLPENQRDRGS